MVVVVVWQSTVLVAAAVTSRAEGVRVRARGCCTLIAKVATAAAAAAAATAAAATPMSSLAPAAAGL